MWHETHGALHVELFVLWQTPLLKTENKFCLSGTFFLNASPFLLTTFQIILDSSMWHSICALCWPVLHSWCTGQSDRPFMCHIGELPWRLSALSAGSSHNLWQIDSRKRKYQHHPSATSHIYTHWRPDKMIPVLLAWTLTASVWTLGRRNIILWAGSVVSIVSLPGAFTVRCRSQLKLFNLHLTLC